MATGGPAAGSKLIGGAHIRLAIDMRAYRKGLDDARKALASFAVDARIMVRVINIRPLIDDFTTLARAIWSAARAMAALNRAMGGGGGGVGRGLGSLFRGLGAGISSVLRGFGDGLASVFRGAGSLARGLGSGLATAARGFGSLLSAPLRALASTIRSLGSLRLPSIGGVGGLGALTAGVGGALATGFILDRSEEMEHTLVRLQRVTGGTRAETNALGVSFNEMASTLAGVPLDRLYELAIMGSRLGVPRHEINLFTRDLAKTGAVLEDISVEEATTYFSGLAAVFNIASSDTIRMASALNKLDIASNASGRDILEVTSRLSGMASTLGLSVQQTLALSAAMRQGRVPIETAGTAMSQIFGRMAGKDLPNFARVAGMTTDAFRKLVSQDALEALIAVEKGLSRLDQFGRIRALETLHLDGQRVRLVMLQLIPLLPQLREYLAITNDEWKTSGSILKGFALQAETARAMIIRMWNNVQLLGTSLGAFFLPVLKGVVNGISSFSYDVRHFVEGNGDLLTRWGENVGRIFENLGAVTRIDWKDAFGVVGAAAKDIWSQFKANAMTAFSNLDQIIKNLIANIPNLLAGAFLKLIPAIAGALSQGVAQGINTILAAMPAAMRKMMGLPGQIAVNAGAAGALPQGPAWNAGLKAMPGMGVPDVLKMLPDMFARGGAEQRQDRVKRDALGGLQDWLARRLAGRQGAQAADPLLNRVRGLAAAEEAGAIGGGMGAAGAGGAAGGPLEAAGGGGGDLGGGMVPPMVPPRGPQAGAAQPAWLGMAATAMGLPILGAPDLHQKKLDLLAWRQRVAGRRGQRRHHMNRRDALRKLEADRRARMEGRMGVAEEVGEGIAARNREFPQFGLQRPGMGMGFRMGIPGALGNVVPRDLTAQQKQPLVGLSSWGNTAVGKIVNAIEGLNDTIERRLSIPTWQ